MIRVIRSVGAFGLLLALSGCTGTPGCSSGDSQDLLGDIIEEAFERSSHGKELRPLVDYRVRSIQTVGHDKDVDRYECAATLEISLVGSDAKPVSQDIEYDVYLIQDDEADFEISFDEGVDTAISNAALRKAMGWR